MKSSVQRFALGMILASGLPASVLHAADTETKALPTLLIKGEIVSVDTTDPAAALIKVKDRYGFETPIFLTPDTAITQGETPVNVAGLSTGAPVEVEYNFDVDTAKRHAVSVKVTAPASAAAPAPAAPEAPAAVPAESAPATAPAAPEAAHAEVVPAPEEAAPAAQ